MLENLMLASKFDNLCPKFAEGKVFYESKRLEIGKMIRELCKWKDVNIITAEVCADHVHMFVEIPPKVSISSFMGFLKGKSSVMIYSRWGNMKYKYRNRSFWCRGYYVDTVGRNKKVIAEYIRNQLEEDYATDQISIKEYMDPFTGNRQK